MSEDLDRRNKDYQYFLAFIGLGLTSWTIVEEQHFLLFRKMLSSISKEICSVLYFSPPSFESRRVLVDRVAQLHLPESLLKEWNALNDDLADGASQRGRLAHYGLDFEVTKEEKHEDGSVSFEFGEVRLRPSSHNHVNILQKKTGEKHTVTTQKLRDYMESFKALEARLKEFSLKMTPAPPKVDYARGLLNFQTTPAEFPQLPPNDIQEDGSPSAQ
jgi:hypothetical protein